MNCIKIETLRKPEGKKRSQLLIREKTEIEKRTNGKRSSKEIPEI